MLLTILDTEISAVSFDDDDSGAYKLSFESTLPIVHGTCKP